MHSSWPAGWGVWPLCGPSWVGKFFLPSVFRSDSVDIQQCGFGRAKILKNRAKVCSPPAQRPGSVIGKVCVFIFWRLSRKGFGGQSNLPHHHCSPGPPWECLVPQGATTSSGWSSRARNACEVWGAPRTPCEGPRVFIPAALGNPRVSFGLSQTPKSWGSDSCFLRGFKKSRVLLFCPQ